MVRPERDRLDSNVRNVFTKSSKGYDAYTKHSINLKKETGSWKKLYGDVLGASSGKLLNVGCGPGTEAIVVAEMGFDVTAVDFSPEMVRLTLENSDLCGVNIDAIEGDAENLPFPDCSFDFIISNYMLWAVPNPDKAMAEWMRVLRPGGKVAFVDGIWSTADYSWMRKRWVRIAQRLRHKDGNSHRDDEPMTVDEKAAMRSLWSVGADRPAADLRMMADAGFEQISIINKVDRRIFSGMRYVEYGYHKVHYMITAVKPGTSA